jgi:DNA invertase Pin-like site-specific DNA recombinase
VSAIAPAPAKKYVGYVRVSTKMQDHSGLGQEAQEAAIDAFVASTGASLVGLYTEVESGRNDGRPVLKAAIKDAKAQNATLLIARLDRLGRNIHFITTLMADKVKFTAVDMPEANEFTVHIMAALAQMESNLISMRTKAAMDAAKARGKVFGGFRTKDGLARSLETRVRNAKEAREPVLKYIQDMLSLHRYTVEEMMGVLTASPYRPAKSDVWSYMTTYRYVTLARKAMGVEPRVRAPRATVVCDDVDIDPMS